MVQEGFQGNREVIVRVQQGKRMTGQVPGEQVGIKCSSRLGSVEVSQRDDLDQQTIFVDYVHKLDDLLAERLQHFFQRG